MTQPHRITHVTLSSKASSRIALSTREWVTDSLLTIFNLKKVKGQTQTDNKEQINTVIVQSGPYINMQYINLLYRDDSNSSRTIIRINNYILGILNLPRILPNKTKISLSLHYAHHLLCYIIILTL